MMMLRIFIFLTAVSWSLAEIVVHDRVMNATIEEIYDLVSTFGPEIPEGGLKGVLREASPINGCHPLAPPPPLPSFLPPSTRHWVALIMRGNCTFAIKVLNGQAAGYSAVIVMDDESDYIQPMSAAGDTADNVSIPSVIVGQTDGAALRNYFKNYRRFSITITDYEPIDFERYLLPFAVTVGICFVAMLCFMLVKCVKDYRRSRKHRMSWRELRRLPLHTFRSAADQDTYECCAICLEDYADGDKLRVLPCKHAYHSRCIDPWLTKRRRVCPVCKAKVRPGGRARQPTSDSDDSDVEATSSNERAPLLQQAAQESASSSLLHRPTEGGNTFTPVSENPFQRAARLAASIRQGYSNLGAEEDEDQATGGVEASAATSSGARAADPPAVMLPGSDDDLNDQLEVVTVTRRKKRKRNRKRDSPSVPSASNNRADDAQNALVNVENEAPVHGGSRQERHTRTPSPRDSQTGTGSDTPHVAVVDSVHTPSPREGLAGTEAEAIDVAALEDTGDDSNGDQKTPSDPIV